MATVAQIAAPQGAASYRGDLRMTYLRWASQEPTEVATAAQIAAPQRAASYRGDLRMTYPRWASQELTKVATVSQIAAPQRQRGLLRSPWDTPLLALPGAHERGDSFADRSPPGDGEL